ncbi:MAG: FeoA domain-containing protein [Spirochaetia bacterium]
MVQCSLRDVPVGGMARIVGFTDIHKSYRAKLLSMGLTRGTPLLVEGTAPFGDPVHVSVRGFSLSLRRDEAQGLVLERIEEASR